MSPTDSADPPDSAGGRRGMGLLTRRPWRLVAVAAVLAVTVATVAGLRGQGAPDLAGAAVDCQQEDPYDYDCWRDRLRWLVTYDSPAAAIDDMRTAHDQVPFVASNCHQLMHEVGRAAGNRYGDVAEAYEYGDDFCASGYFHGVLEAFALEIGKENLLADPEQVCASVREDHMYAVAHFNCVHGLGHGLMAVTGVELFLSLETCDRFPDSWEANSCYGGVFMENIMSSLNPHHDTQYLRDDDLMYPCTEVEDRYRYECYQMQTSHALQRTGWNVAEVFTLCEEVDEAYRFVCGSSLGRDISGSTLNDVDGTKNLCLLGNTDETVEGCFIGAAKDFVFHLVDDTRALELCAAIEDSGMSQRCEQAVITQYQSR